MGPDAEKNLRALVRFSDQYSETVAVRWHLQWEFSGGNSVEKMLLQAQYQLLIEAFGFLTAEECLACIEKVTKYLDAKKA